MTVKYAAVVDEVDAGGYVVWFPDFAGCIAQAEDPFSAVQAARRALLSHMARMAAEGEVIPQPTPAEAVELPHDLDCTVFLVEAEAPDVKPRYLRLNVTLPEGLVRRIDAVAGGNRSAWLAQAAAEQLKRYATTPSYAASVYSKR